MTALIADREITRYGSGPVSTQLSYTVATGETLYTGGLAALDASGTLVAAGSAGTVQVVGVTESQYAAGETAIVTQGAYWLVNGDSIAAADVGSLCYAGDDQTVYSSSADGLRKAAGIVLDVHATKGVLVQVGIASRHISGIRLVSDTFAHDDIDVAVAATSMSRTIGYLPAGSVVLGGVVRVTEDWSDGSTGTVALDIGDGTDADEFLADAGNIDNGVAVTRTYCGEQQDVACSIVATITASVNLSTLTGGELSIELIVADCLGAV